MRATILLVCFVVGAPAGGARARPSFERGGRRGPAARVDGGARRGRRRGAGPRRRATATPNEKTDADLMYEAMREWRGEPRGSAAVARVLAESQRVHQERKAAEAKLRSLFFKDPFADDPEPADPGPQDRPAIAGGLRGAPRHRSLDARDRKRWHACAASWPQARADAAAARAEASRLRGELARGGDGADGACVRRVGRRSPRASTAAARWPRTIASRTTGPRPAPARRHRRAKPRAAVAQRRRPPPAPPRQSSPRRRPAGAAAIRAGSSSFPSRRPVSIRADVPR